MGFPEPHPHPPAASMRLLPGAPTPFTRGLATCALLFCAACGGWAEARQADPGGIVLDGLFDDWRDQPVLLRDPVGATATSPVGVTALRVADEPAWLHLSFELGRAVNAQAMPGTLHLVLDVDHDETTGGIAFGMPGADLVLDLSVARAGGGGNDGEAHGAGFALRGVGASGPEAHRSAYELGVAALPTWASERFELRVSRLGAPDGSWRMAPRIRVGVAASTSAGATPVGEAASWAFRSPAGPPAPASLAPLLERADGAFRVAQWNVSEGSFREPEVHGRLLAAVRPDVVLLDEVHGGISHDALADFFAHPDLAALGSWSWALGAGGGRQRTVVAARDRRVRPEPSMERVEYDLAELEELRARVPPRFHAALDLEARIHMSAAGAWVDLEGTEVLFVPLDLQSAGYLGSPQDLLREVQARTLHRHVLAALDATGRRAPVVVGGDFNVVGSRTPLDILAAGLDVDGSDLTVAGPRRLGDGAAYTWHDPRWGPFAPGRLDLTLYAAAALEEVGGFVFDTAELTDGQLARLGLARAMSAATSDHLLVVTDLRLR